MIIYSNGNGAAGAKFPPPGTKEEELITERSTLLSERESSSDGQMGLIGASCLVFRTGGTDMEFSRGSEGGQDGWSGWAGVAGYRVRKPSQQPSRHAHVKLRVERTVITETVAGSASGHVLNLPPCVYVCVQMHEHLGLPV